MSFGLYPCISCRLGVIKTFSLQKCVQRSLNCSSFLYKAAPSKSNLTNVVSTHDVITDCEGAKTSGFELAETNEKENLSATITSLPQQYLMLSKIRLTSLVVMTSMCGYAMAPAAFSLPSVVVCTIGTGLLSCAANAVNQFHEVPFDAQMARTRNRLLVRSIVTPLHAIGFATVCASTGGLLLYFGANGLTAALGATNLILYTSIYTPLKRISIINTWVGSVVGALPPLMGWSCATGALGPGAWVLAGILYAWQFPHFNALSWNLRPDYSRAGYRMMAVTDPGLCRRTTVRYTAAILALSCAAPFVDLTNYWFTLESLPLNAYFLYLAPRMESMPPKVLCYISTSEGGERHSLTSNRKPPSSSTLEFYKKSDSSSSRKLFRFSLIHLPVLMLLMLINKKSSWFSNEEDKEKDGVLQ